MQQNKRSSLKDIYSIKKGSLKDTYSTHKHVYCGGVFSNDLGVPISLTTILVLSQRTKTCFLNNTCKEQVNVKGSLTKRIVEAWEQ